MATEPPASPVAVKPMPESTALSLRLARWAVVPVVGMLWIDVAGSLRAPGDPAWFFTARAWFDLCLSLILLLPFVRIAQRSKRAWWALFTALALGTAAFAFWRVIGVMFEAIAAAEAGEKLGVPGWSGMLIFGVLSQVPTVLFNRFPDELN